MSAVLSIKLGRQRSEIKRFCSNSVLCVSCTWQIVKTLVIRLRGVEGRNACNQIAFWLLCIPFILTGSRNECWVHICDACVITTWRLGLRAPLVARNYADVVVVVVFFFLTAPRGKASPMQVWLGRCSWKGNTRRLYWCSKRAIWFHY